MYLCPPEGSDPPLPLLLCHPLRFDMKEMFTKRWKCHIKWYLFLKAPEALPSPCVLALVSRQQSVMNLMPSQGSFGWLSFFGIRFQIPLWTFLLTSGIFIRHTMKQRIYDTSSRVSFVFGMTSWRLLLMYTWSHNFVTKLFVTCLDV